ncbi:MAG TPA: H-NS histone family protein, partial [Thauera sp.]|nr:H-NS histone family protein [Thauera sp.]
ESAAAPQKAKSPLKAKYRDPATGETWVGRGATPKWMRAYLEAGRNKDEFLI